MILLQIIIERKLSAPVLSDMHSENGLYEIIQFFILFLSFNICLLYFISNTYKTALLKFWFALAGFCCFYVAGEEISWGQHFLNWKTPEEWASLNDQNETNLHNTSSWLDQKPRALLFLGIVGGTIIIPLLQKFNILKLPENLKYLMPPRQLIWIALILVLAKITEKVSEFYGVSVFTRFSEVEELYMFYFVLLYLSFLFQRTHKKILT